jgi:hypothetical protein
MMENGNLSVSLERRLKTYRRLDVPRQCCDRERAPEGLRGRPPSMEASRVREMKAQGMRPSDIAKALKIDRASV